MDDDRPNLRALPSGRRTTPRTKRVGSIPVPGPGRKPMFVDPDVEARILQFVQLGASWTRAAMAAGVSHKALYDWRRKANEGQEPYVAFMAKVDRAEAECEMRLVAMYHQAIPGDARGIERFLRTRFPERWNPDRMEVIDVEEIDLDEPITTVEHLSEVVAALEEAGLVAADEA